MLTSWPALSVAFDGDWVIRLADGYTKRSNSVTCLGDDDVDLERRIDRVQAIYDARGLPATFRLSPLAPSSLDAALDERGWRRFDETIVMTCDLAVLEVPSADDVEIATAPDRAWLESCDRIGGATAPHFGTLKELLNRLIPHAGYGRIGATGRIDALALVVVDAELAGLFEVLTIPEKRRQGLARRLVLQLFAWSRTKGATTGWLAVVADNQPAVRLYQSLGFREVYRYHYRSND